MRGVAHDAAGVKTVVRGPAFVAVVSRRLLYLSSAVTDVNSRVKGRKRPFDNDEDHIVEIESTENVEIFDSFSSLCLAYIPILSRIVPRQIAI